MICSPKYNSKSGKLESVVINNMVVPADTNNMDYQNFLQWNMDNQYPIKESLPDGYSEKMVPNYQSLKNEITNDPANLGYQDKLDWQIADLLNSKTQTMATEVTIPKVLTWAGKFGVFVKLDGAQKSNNPMAQNIASTALTMLVASNVKALHLNDPDVFGMLQYLVSQGIFETTDMDALLALAQESVSRAELLWGKGITVTAGDIKAVL